VVTPASDKARPRAGFVVPPISQQVSRKLDRNKNYSV